MPNLPLVSLPEPFLLHFFPSCFAQVFPGAWTAILISLDNVGVWNLRTDNLDSWYLGQETYVKVYNPEVNNKTEFPMPDNALFCGSLSKLQKYVSEPVSIFSIFKFLSRSRILNSFIFVPFSGPKKSPRQHQSWVLRQNSYGVWW